MTPSTKIRRAKRWLIGLSLFGLSGFLFAAQPARALFGIGDITFNTTIEDLPRAAAEAIKIAATETKERVKDSTAIAFKNATRTFLATITREFATSLATTQPGQKPLFLTNPKTFFRDVADAAAGDFIDDFTRGVTGGRWDPRCDSTDPEVRAKCQGVIGGTVGRGDPTSGERGRFIISRLLRAGSNATFDGCLSDCKKEWGLDGVNTPTVPPNGITDLAQLNRYGTYTNDYERAASLLNIWKTSLDAAVKSDPGEDWPLCSDVWNKNALPPDVAGPELEPHWEFRLNWCRAGGSGANCRTTAQECLIRVEEALLNDASDAATGLRKCTKNCSTGFGADARGLVNRATATDVFKYVENYDIRQAPAEIARRFSNNSDIGQYFSAAGLLVSQIEEKRTGERTRLSAGVLPRTSSVSQKVLAPKEAASALFGIPFYNNQGELTYTGTGFADILKGLASLINSPVGKALFTYFKSKCGLNPDACKGPTNPQSVVGRILFGSGGPSGIEAARIQFAGLGQIDYINGSPGSNEVDVLGQLTSAGLMDPALRTAVEENLTVREAMSRQLIGRNRVVGFTKDGIEAKDGYPFRSLQYLRKYRIIPIGWELAAKYAFSFRADDLTIGTLVDHYNICAQDVDHKVCSTSLAACKADTDCQTGETCGASPFCGLVDPDWVLKAPQTFCRRQGAGEEIVNKEFVCDQNNTNKNDGSPIKGLQSVTSTPENADDPGPANCVYDAEKNAFPDIGRWIVTRNTDTCADTQSCLTEDDNGNCLAYGYCVQERQTFKFDGTQCESQNASCTTYTNSAGQKVSYLASTLNKNCSADSAGCGWYCAEPSYNTTTKSWQCSATAGDKAYLTAKAGDCKSGDAGCRQFIRLVPGTNVLPNGGFEYYQGGALGSDPAAFTGWSSGLISMVPVSASDSGAGTNQVAVRVTAPDRANTISQTVDLGSSLNERSFTFSLRTTSALACTGQLTLCTGPSCGSSGLVRTAPFPASGTWETGSVTLDVPSQAALALTDTRMTVVIQPDGCRDAGLQLDRAQLVEATDATEFVDYGQANLVHLNGQRRSCTTADVGCEKYTPVSGGAAVNGIIATANRCTADQVGCQLYRREPISQIPYRDYNPANPAAAGQDQTIVAAKGQQCSAADVGCEEYTNLDTVSQGGEGKEYYQSVKQCAKPSNAAVTKQTYYTWFGDPDRGFVLRSQQLVVSNIANAGPCTKLGVARAAGAGTTNPVCEDTASTVAAATCTDDDLSDDSDCGEFYDSNLNIYYRLRSKTVTVTEDCHPYRNTIDETDDQYTGNRGNIYYLSRKENVSCSERAAGCRAFTGNTGRTNRTVIRDSFDDRNLTKWVGGTFSSAAPSAGGHSMRIDVAPGSATALAYTTVDSVAGKIQKNKTYILKITAAAANDTANTRLRAFLGTEVAGSPGTFQTLGGVDFQSGGSGNALTWNEGITPAGPEWHTYTYGPVTIGDVVNPQWRLGIGIDNGAGYIDSLTLTEVNDQTFLINNTAPTCPNAAIGCTAYRARNGQLNYTTSFARLCSSEVVGCEAMVDTQNSTSPFTQTVKNVTTPADQLVTVVNDAAAYCKLSAKGCTMYGEPIFGRDDTVTSFRTVYKINDPDQHESSLCLATEDSCDVFTDSGGTATYFKDPRSRTCEFRSGNGLSGGWFITGTTYRCPVITPPAGGQPVGQSCSPICTAGARAGKPCAGVGSSVECPGSVCAGDAATIGRVQNADGRAVYGQCQSDAQCLGNNKCVYLVGTCPAGENGCTEYRDPTEPTSCRSECPLELAGGTPINVDSNCVKTVCTSPDASNRRNGQNCTNNNDCGTSGKCVGLDGSTPTVGAPGCRAYYYLRQSVEDTTGDCSGQVNTAIGCRPFNDTSNPTLNFRGI